MTSIKPVIGTTRPKPFKLGTYPNNPEEYEAEVQERQESVVLEVGKYLIQRTPQHRHWVGRTKDGKPLPRSLEGRWLSPETFAKAAEKFQQGTRSKNAE